MALPSSPDFSVKPTLTGEKVVLRPFAAADFPVLLAALADPEVLRLTGSVHDAHAADGPDDTERFLEVYRLRNLQPDRLDLAVVDKASGECVGEVVLNEWEPARPRMPSRVAQLDPAQPDIVIPGCRPKAPAAGSRVPFPARQALVRGAYSGRPGVYNSQKAAADRSS